MNEDGGVIKIYTNVVFCTISGSYGGMVGGAPGSMQHQMAQMQHHHQQQQMLRQQQQQQGGMGAGMGPAGVAGGMMMGQQQQPQHPGAHPGAHPGGHPGTHPGGMGMPHQGNMPQSNNQVSFTSSKLNLLYI